MANVIYHDINKSTYIYKYGDLTFYFSSLLYLNKFVNQFNNYIEEEAAKLNNKFNMKINSKSFLLITFYKKIEKRGFKVLLNNIPLEKDFAYLCVKQCKEV